MCSFICPGSYYIKLIISSYIKKQYHSRNRINTNKVEHQSRHQLDLENNDDDIKVNWST